MKTMSNGHHSRFLADDGELVTPIDIAPQSSVLPENPKPKVLLDPAEAEPSLFVALKGWLVFLFPYMLFFLLITNPLLAIGYAVCVIVISFVRKYSLR
jgi:hypothetical protein